MITVKSNINEFLKNYRKKVGNFKSTLYAVAEKLAEKMISYMKSEIERTHSTWYEKGSYAHIRTVDFEIIPLSSNSIRVEIGKNLDKFIMSDGTLVNPAFFIEFGFGILGEKAPMKDHEKFEWEYNINGHTKGWSYLGRDEEFHGSKGRVGTNFMYNAKQKAKDFLQEIMTEIGNG